MTSLATQDPQGSITLDSSAWPILVIVYPRIATPEMVTNLYQRWEELFVRGPHAVLSDLRRFNPVTAPPKLRRMSATEVEKRRAALERLLIAEARVVTDPVVRGL